MATVDEILALFSGDDVAGLPATTPNRAGQKYGLSRGATNASEQALIRQKIEAGDSDDPNIYEGSDSQIEDQMMKTIENIGPDKFFAMPGTQAMQAIGLKDGELARFWDQLDPNDRMLLARAIGSSAGMASPDAIEEEVGRAAAEADKDDVVNTIMQDDR